MFELFGIKRIHHCIFCCQFETVYIGNEDTLVCKVCGQILDQEDYWLFQDGSNPKRVKGVAE